ncbi:MAG: transcription antitermination factor NusB [Desulfosalsimonadaceae bacterium]
MSTRHQSREMALQILYCMDMLEEQSQELYEALSGLLAPRQPPSAFCRRLVEGVVDRLEELDGIIEQHSSNWRVYRMSGVDRNLLRLGVFEMLYCDDIPAKVAINEAVEIGKKFGTEETGPFVNGVLDGIRQYRLHDSPPAALHE